MSVALITVIYLSNFLIIVILGSFVYFKNPKNLVNKYFLLLCVYCAYWNFTALAFRVSPDYETAYLWLRLGGAWPFALCGALHFSLVYTKRFGFLSKKWSYVVIYGPCIFFSAIDMTTPYLIGIPKPASWGWTAQSPDDPLLFYISTICFVSTSIVTVALNIPYYRKLTGKKEKKQAIYVMGGLITPIVLGDISYMIINGLNIDIPSFAAPSMGIGCALLGIGIWRHQLFDVATETAADNIIETLNEMLFLVDREGKIIVINRATRERLGYTEFELLNQNIQSLFEKSKRNKKIIEAAMNTGSISNYESVIRAKNNKLIPVTISLSSICDESDVKYGYVIICGDITERKKAEKKIRAMNKRLLEEAHKAGMSEIAVDVVHNIGNILNSVNISVDLIINRINSSKAKGLVQATEVIQEHQENIAEFISRSKRGKVMIPYLQKAATEIQRENDILKQETMRIVDRIELIRDVIRTQESYTQGFSTKLNENINLISIINDILRMQESSLKERNVRIVKKYPEGSKYTVFIHKIKSMNVLMNIVKNAYEAMENNENDNRTITFDIIEVEGAVELSVTDVGEGISENHLTKIFNQGFTTKKHGHGLGLHTCGNYIKEMDGSIKAESEGEGKGTMIRIRFPLPSGSPNESDEQIPIIQ